MYLHTQQLINEIVVDEPDPAAANALQEGLGGQFGEMRTMMQYLFQSINFRGDAAAKPYRDLLQGVGTEEISHVELIGTTIARLLDGSPQYQGKPTDPVDEPGKKGRAPLSIALDTGNIHHYLVGAQSALPVDAAGNPWLGSYVYNSGNLVLDLLYNLMLESTGRLQKCRIYEMTDNKTARSTIAYLIVRDQAHENAFAKALESLGVNWGKVLPIPKTNAEQFPEVKKLTDAGLQSIQYTFSADNLSEAAKLYRGASPSNDGTQLSTAVCRRGFRCPLPRIDQRNSPPVWIQSCWPSSRPPQRSNSTTRPADITDPIRSAGYLVGRIESGRDRRTSCRWCRSPRRSVLACPMAREHH